MTILESPDTSTAVGLPRPGAWSLHWRGRTFHESMLTGQHLATLALLTGSDDFEALDIDPRHGHQRLMQMLTVFVCIDAVRTSGVDDADQVALMMAAAIDEVSKASVDELLGSLQYE